MTRGARTSHGLPRAARGRTARLLAWVLVAASFAHGTSAAEGAPEIDGLVAQILRGGTSWRRTEALVNLGPRAVEPLVRLATDPARSEAERIVAIEALGRLEDPGARDALTELLQARTTPLTFVSFLEAALYLIGEPQYFEARLAELTKLARHSVAETAAREQIAEMHYRIGEFEPAARTMWALVTDHPANPRVATWSCHWACYAALLGKPDVSIRALRLAEAWGADLRWIRSDGDLASLRTRPDFENMIARLPAADLEPGDAQSSLEPRPGSRVDVSALAKLADPDHDDAWLETYLGLLHEHPGDENLGRLANGAIGRGARRNRMGDVRGGLEASLSAAPRGAGADAMRLALGGKAFRSGDEAGARAYFAEVLATSVETDLRASATGVLYEIDSLAIGARAPAIEARDAEGHPFSLRACRGQVVLLVFWSTSSAAGLVELANAWKLAREHAPIGLRLVSVSTDTDMLALARALEWIGPDWPVLCDGQGLQGALAARYHVERVPRTFVIDRSGLLSHKDLHGADLETALSSMLTQAVNDASGKRAASSSSPR